jgi:hypothetical protein
MLGHARVTGLLYNAGMATLIRNVMDDLFQAEVYTAPEGIDVTEESYFEYIGGRDDGGLFNRPSRKDRPDLYAKVKRGFKFCRKSDAFWSDGDISLQPVPVGDEDTLFVTLRGENRTSEIDVVCTRSSFGTLAVGGTWSEVEYRSIGEPVHVTQK